MKNKNSCKFGFTLIELLVVVLIIGILASIALPQYQKAVERARAMEAFPLLKSLDQAAQTHYLANGSWPKNFDELEVEMPWVGTIKWRTGSIIKDTRSNSYWSLQIYEEPPINGAGFYLGRISGRYKGVGFGKYLDGHWCCIELTSGNMVFSGGEGDYCVKIMHAASDHSTYADGRYYRYTP